jgi:transketolase
MNLKKLQNIANILRRDVLKMTTKAGSGHPTSCLSCAEIMSVLFFHEMKYDINDPFNLDNDEFILSKGHAAPILYSALYRVGAIKTDLMKLRKLNSPLEGHPVPRSLNWIKVATGSLGQGLGVGAGFALASKLQKRNFKTFVLLGDSEVAEGSVYEAFEIAEHYKLKNLVAIIDINRLGQSGETMYGHKINSYRERFKGFGWKVLEVNGHNLKQILKALEKARKSSRPTVILAKTFKGRGVSFLENKDDWHGKTLNEVQLEKALKEVPNPRIPKTVIKKPKSIRIKELGNKVVELKEYGIGEEIATREAYGNTLAALAKSNSNIIVVDAEVSNSTKSGMVKQVNKNQFIEAYIAEQNMASMALGLSKKGFNVFASTFAAFFSRAFDQIRMAAISSGNLTFSGSHSGVSIGEDGASQMGLEDIALFRNLPNSMVLYPSDAVSCENLVLLASKLKGIKYIRTTREKTSVLYDDEEEFKLGDFKVLKESKKDKLVLVGSGITLHESLKAYERLQKDKVNVSVVDLYCVKPFDSKKFKSFVKKHGNKIIIIEDHHIEGGIGEMLTRELENSNIKIKHLAIQGIPHSGKSKELLNKYGISANKIFKEVRKFR